ncbi:terpene synthase family protein [Streptomyces sp. G45]|uniref:terpene synthase family protein n=1 Tax=Streptomyces sp. G45 TaxID=3406627 RepID=UPI003C13B9E9
MRFPCCAHPSLSSTGWPAAATWCAIERFGGFELPEEVTGCPQLRVMRQLSSDILTHSNDLRYAENPGPGRALAHLEDLTSDRA